jgi:hypothetical protein
LSAPIAAAQTSTSPNNQLTLTSTAFGAIHQRHTSERDDIMTITWKHIDGPHWHRGSIYPSDFTPAEMREESVEDSSRDQYATAAEAMSITNVMSALVGSDTSRWANWSVKSSTVRAGAVKFFSTIDLTLDGEIAEYIYFPKKCAGNCDSDRGSY